MKHPIKSTITKWGNSLAIRLPMVFVKQVGLTEGGEVEIKLKNDEIILSKPKQSLPDLIELVTKENTHNESSIGQLTEKEIW